MTINKQIMITINGKSFKGNNVSIINNEVIIDGKKANSDDDSKIINISIDGNIESLNVDYCEKIEVVGECESVSSKNGNIAIQGNVSGDVTNKNGNIICRNVGGDASTKNGDVVHS